MPKQSQSRRRASSEEEKEEKLDQALQEFERKNPGLNDDPPPQSVRQELPNGSLIGALGLFFLELVKIIALAAITIGIVRYFFIQPFYVKGKSMEPTFYEHEYLIIDKFTYRLRQWRDLNDIQRGDVVVLRAPNQEKEHYLKRVIGLPGERIKITEDRIIIYNEENPQGLVLEEPYVQTEEEGTVQTVTLAENQYYVLGDNRGASFDSRRFGPIDRESIIGRTWFRGWPLTRITTFHAPEYTN